jgi:hypothetical protein
LDTATRRTGFWGERVWIFCRVEVMASRSEVAFAAERFISSASVAIDYFRSGLVVGLDL